ncbi:hypothetical protein JCM10212_001422 [Sporobolomyces blumeae]
MSTQPPEYLLPGFDPSKAKVAQLRGILLEHDVPYASNAKKPDLVALFNSKVKPLIPRLNADLSAVRASDDGVLDGESHDGSLKELDTDPEEETNEEDARAARAKGKGRKVRSKRKSTVARARDEAERDESAQEDDESSAVESRGTRGKGRGRKSVRVSSPAFERDDGPVEYDEVVPLAGEPSHASPRKRKASTEADEATPRSASALKARRRTIQYESGGEGGFSDYNPFQSGGEETPNRTLKRRKSSLGPDRLKEKRSLTFDEPLDDEPPQSRVPSPKKPRQSAPAAPFASTAGSSQVDQAARSEEKRKAAVQMLLDPDGARDSPARPLTTLPREGGRRGVHDGGGAPSSKTGTPVGKKYMVPVEKIKTPPKDKREELGRAMHELEMLSAEIQEEDEWQEQDARLEEPEKRARRRGFAEETELDLPNASEGVEVDAELGEDHEEDEDMSPLDEDTHEDEMQVDNGDPDWTGLYTHGNDYDDYEAPVEPAAYTPAVPAVSSLRGSERAMTPRRSEPLPYSPRHALTQAASTPRRSYPLPTPPASSSRRQLVASGRPSFAKQNEHAISLRPSTSPTAEAARKVQRVSTWSLLVLALLYSLWWREEKLAAGFCDTNSRTNAIVESRSTSLALPSLPPALTSALSDLNLVPTCTPCPAHGFCSQGAFVGCSIDYVPRASPLRLGGLLPVAPTCVPDTEKLMVVAMQASKASKLLRKRRGEVVCQRGIERLRKKQAKDETGLGDKEAFVYGLQAEHVLSALMRENEASKSPFSEDVLEELNRVALNDLVQHGEVLTWQAGDDFWYASKTAEMPLSCQARLAAIRSAKKHKTGLGGIVSGLLSLLYLRYKLQARVEEKKRVAELVQTALVQLQRQERSHHADPVLVPFPHIAPSHLRDLVLQHVHSPERRAQLWRKVEKVVEGNSNVRVMEVEQNGEELRGWKWIGATGPDRDGARDGGTPIGRREIEDSGSTSGTPARIDQGSERPVMQQSAGARRIIKAAL